MILKARGSSHALICQPLSEFGGLMANSNTRLKQINTSRLVQEQLRKAIDTSGEFG